MRLDGILLVDKPEGMSSAGVVREVKRRLAVGKVGHLGTLDPFATGLLPLCLGEGAKVVPFLNQEEKSYEGTIRLGLATDTLDRTGEETERAPVPALAETALAEAAARFTGEIEQVPPMYSALKRGGVPLYELARRGVEVEREARRVTIERFVLRANGPDKIDFEVDCSKGTYVRVLAADIARALGTVAHLERLRRTRFGAFTVDRSAALDSIAGDADLPFLSAREALASRELEIDAEGERRIRLGQQAVLRDLPPPSAAGEIAKAIARQERLVAILGEERGTWKILRVFA
ncbi:MAG: tRNA pseudouridine(55) synthase TruB [Candidatus Binatia bacterium]